jgi:uncharacterized damage-inducible protein DinB
MVTRIPWTERRFEFAFPPGVYAEVVERMRGTPARLEDRVRDLPPAVRTKREGEHWSIQEHAGHLLELESLWLGRLDDYLAGRDVLRAADMSNRATAEGHYNQRPLEEILAAFRRTRIAGVARLDALEPDAFATTARHPRLGVPMRLIDMLYFQAHHDDYHLATITELMRTLAVR